MSKNILCYGDSLTWGFNPKDGTRFPYEETWPGVMEKSLGENYCVITEALVARTTCWDIPYAPYRNGKEYLPMLMESHSPLDLVIIMLGANDLMKLCGKTADESAWGLLGIVRIAMTSLWGAPIPKVLIVAPPVPSEMTDFNKMGFDGRQDEIAKLPHHQKIIAETAMCEFMDSNDFIKVTGGDGLHPLPDQYKILGEVIAEKVRKMKI